MRVRFLFYKHERAVSSDFLSLGELLDLIARGYPGAQILGIEVTETAPNAEQPKYQSDQKSTGYDQTVYCDPISVS